MLVCLTDIFSGKVSIYGVISASGISYVAFLQVVACLDITQLCVLWIQSKTVDSSGLFHLWQQ